MCNYTTINCFRFAEEEVVEEEIDGEEKDGEGKEKEDGVWTNDESDSDDEEE